jgi:protein O-GlcNAc transferase
VAALVWWGVGVMDLEAAFSQAVAHHRSGRVGEAEGLCRSILAEAPGHARALHLLGAIRFAGGQAEEAIGLLERAVAAKPDYGEAEFNLGVMLAAADRLEDAARHFGRACELRPENSDAHVRLGAALMELDHPGAAEASFLKALALRPEDPLILTDLAAVALDQGHADAAADYARRAIARAPDLPQAHLRLGRALKKLDAKADAMTAFRRATELAPDAPYAWSNLGLMYGDAGAVDKATSAFGTAVRLQPNDAELHSSLICLQPLDPDVAPAEMVAERRRWAERFADPLTRDAPPHSNGRNPGRRLRIGYVAATTPRYHTSAMVILPLIEAHDRSRMEVYCYSDVSPDDEDEVTARYRKASTFRATYALDDERLAELIRRDSIDILVDPFGHPVGTRLLALARRPAPIQICFPTMGSHWMAAIDYTITDPAVTPRPMLLEFRERVVRVPVGHVYRPLCDVPPRAKTSAFEQTGVVTFGYLGRASRLNDAALQCWAEILRHTEGARLRIRRGFAGDGLDRRLERCGIDPRRVSYLDWVDNETEYLAAYNELDVVLDPFPYGGVTTSCEALLMGVPIVTLAADRVLGRYTAAFLIKLGLGDLVGSTREAYVRAAVGLAQDHQRRRALRSELSARFLNSRLCDASAMARDLERVFGAMWRRWCGGASG